MKKIILLLFILTSAFVFSACNGPTRTPPKQPPLPNTVYIKNFSFDPAELVVKKGDKVTWINTDTANHTIQSPLFSSTEISNGQNFTFTFDTVGTFEYICTIHPQMKGKIIVQ